MQCRSPDFNMDRGIPVWISELSGGFLYFSGIQRGCLYSSVENGISMRILGFLCGIPI